MSETKVVTVDLMFRGTASVRVPKDMADDLAVDLTCAMLEVKTNPDAEILSQIPEIDEGKLADDVIDAIGATVTIENGEWAAGVQVEGKHDCCCENGDSCCK